MDQEKPMSGIELTSLGETEDVDCNTPYFQSRAYATRKTVAQGALDFALLMANASQLKALVDIPSNHRGNFYIILLVLLALSIFLQITAGIILLVLGMSNPKDNKSRRRTVKLNNASVAIILLISAVNVFISAFGISYVDSAEQPGSSFAKTVTSDEESRIVNDAATKYLAGATSWEGSATVPTADAIEVVRRDVGETSARNSATATVHPLTDWTTAGVTYEIPTTSYTLIKTVGAGALDFALLMANSSTLKALVDTPSNRRGNFYFVLLVLLGLSIVLQVVTGVILVLLGRTKPKEERSYQRMDALNNASIFLILFITIANVFISTFGVSYTNAPPANP